MVKGVKIKIFTHKEELCCWDLKSKVNLIRLVKKITDLLDGNEIYTEGGEIENGKV